jgi:hypothetical protein
MAGITLTDDEWLNLHMPNATEDEEEMFLERLSMRLEHNSSPTWSETENARIEALKEAKN